MDTTQFDWDDANIQHIAEHKVLPEEAEQALIGLPMELDFDATNREERWTYVGETNKGRILTIVFTIRDDRMRVVTAFPPISSANAKIPRVEGSASMTNLESTKSRLVIPAFATEAEEAKWWFDNQDLIDQEFEKAAQEGRLKRGDIHRLLAERRRSVAPSSDALQAVDIALDPADVDMATEQAAKRGLHYQTYLRTIIHEALLKAESAS